MKTKLKYLKHARSLRRESGAALFFWVLAFVIIVVLAIAVTLIIINLCRKLEQFKPRWDDVNHIFVEEVERARQEYGPEADISVNVPEILPLGFGLVFQSTNILAIPTAQVLAAAENPGEGWQTNESGNIFIAVPMGNVDAAFPPIDLNVPAMFYHRYVVLTNQ